MNTLSIRNPWAALIVHGIKTVENRDWKRIPNQPPQWLAIHSSQKAEPGAEQFLSDGYKVSECCNGSILGAALWTGSYNRKTCPKKILRNEFACGPVFLVFEKAVRIEPFYCKGRLGFWPTPAEAQSRILMEINRCGYSLPERSRG